MSYLLDTNICIYIMRQHPCQVFERFRKEGVGRVGISSISVAELSYGVAKSQRAARNARALDEFLYPLTVHAFDKPAAHAYGHLRALLERQGTPIGPLDTLIAAHALSLDATLVTNNVSEFRRIPDLKIENWAEV
jgi:tRNA(fMet)-specific endonuclease VapC